MNLEEVMLDSEKELTILENVRRCRNIVGREFRVIFWHENLSEDVIKKFIKRNENLLFEVNTKITKRHDFGWFVITKNRKDKSKYRYMYDGDILTGIVQYVKIIKHIKKRESNEGSDNR